MTGERCRRGVWRRRARTEYFLGHWGGGNGVWRGRNGGEETGEGKTTRLEVGAHSVMERRWDGGGGGMFGGTPAYRSPTLDRSTDPPGLKVEKARFVNGNFLRGAPPPKKTFFWDISPKSGWVQSSY